MCQTACGAGGQRQPDGASRRLTCTWPVANPVHWKLKNWNFEIEIEIEFQHVCNASAHWGLKIFSCPGFLYMSGKGKLDLEIKLGLGLGRHTIMTIGNGNDIDLHWTMITNLHNCHHSRSCPAYHSSCLRSSHHSCTRLPAACTRKTHDNHMMMMSHNLQRPLSCR